MLTLARLRDILEYDPETGYWTWIRPPKHNRKLLGQRAGTFHNFGYTMIRIGGQLYYSHRLAHFYMTGSWPKEEMDHIDRNPCDDRWSNLREATSSLNKRNSSRWLGEGVLI